MFNNVPYLLVVKQDEKDRKYEVVRNFSETIFAETTINIDRILPSFGGMIVLKLGDGSYKYYEELKDFKSTKYMDSDNYYDMQTLPPANYSPVHY